MIIKLSYSVDKLEIQELEFEKEALEFGVSSWV